MRVAVVGASGFVGSAVCLALEARGHTVVPLRAPRIDVDPAADIAQQLPAVEISRLARQLHGTDATVNCAGNPDASSADLRGLYGANAAIPLLVGRAAQAAECRRFIHVSSAVVQGAASRLDDSPPPPRGFSPYADSKVSGERLLGSLPSGFVTTYRPPSVHAPGRRITRSLGALSRHGLGVVAGDGRAHTPQALLPNVADAIAFVATTEETPPAVVIHPWEGCTTESLLQDLGGRRPWHLPGPLLRLSVQSGYLTARLAPGLTPHVRRAELMMFGQGQAPSWLSENGWLPPLGREAWKELATPSADEPVDENVARALVVASVASMIDQFNMPNIRLLLDLGARVEVASNFEDGNTISAERIKDLQTRLETWGVPWHQVDFSRSPFAGRAHVRASWQLDRIIARLRPDLVHCHSPIGGAIARTVARRHGVPCIYTAHGFHFSSASPRRNWLIYYPLERLLGPLTHTLVTINGEDQRRAHRLGASAVLPSPGVGVDVESFADLSPSRADARSELGLGSGTFCLLSVGELNDNKNHQVVLHALAELKDLDLHYLLCGQGSEQKRLKVLADDLGLSERVSFLGYRPDVKRLYAAADLFAFPSCREGLPVSLIEAMASGLPCVASRIRGVNDLLTGPAVRFLVDPLDSAAFARQIRTLAEDPVLSRELGQHNRSIAGAYSVQAALAAIEPTYRSLLGGGRPARDKPH